jgi:hypothetical protein
MVGNCRLLYLTAPVTRKGGGRDKSLSLSLYERETKYPAGLMAGVDNSKRKSPLIPLYERGRQIR